MILDAQFIDMLDWENKIYQEYKWIGWKKYKQGRIKFLLSQIKNHTMNAINLKNLIDYINNKNPKIGVFLLNYENLPTIEDFESNQNKVNDLFDIIYTIFVYGNIYDKERIKKYAKITTNEFLVMKEKVLTEFINRQSNDVTIIRKVDLNIDLNFNEKLKEKLKKFRIIYV